MKIIMTGSTGFVGQNLLLHLFDKYIEIKSISRTTLYKLKDFDLENYEIIIHLASKTHDSKNVSSSDEYYQVNYDLTKQLYDVFLKSDAKKFIFLSSVKAVADSVSNALIENYSPNPQTHYGKSKLMAEQYIQSQPLPEGKSYYILRPCMIHGPGNKGNLELLYKFIQKGIPYPLGAYRNERSFLSINNLNFIIEQLINDQSIPGGIYNLADDCPLSTNKVLNIMANVNGIKLRLWKLSPRLINFLAAAGDILHAPFNTERLKKLTESYVVSNKKIKKALNITHFPISSEEGLKLTIQSFHST